MSLQKRPGCYVLQGPTAPEVPVLFDSPHSGIEWPNDFVTAASREAILTSWDAYVDQLWGEVPSIGGVLLAGLFPRAYVDTNRAVTDIDPDLLDSPWPEKIATTDYTRRGLSLIRREALPGVAMYDRKLSVEAVRHRIDAFYQPYRDMLGATLDSLWRRYGAVWHVNCHSMKSRGNAMNTDNGGVRPDIVVSDREGATAAGPFTTWVAKQFTALGYEVKINTPYRGGDIIATHGDPARHRHSIQIEVNRALYMDEVTFAKSDGFAPLQQNFGRFATALRDYVRASLNLPPAKTP